MRTSALLTTSAIVLALGCSAPAPETASTPAAPGPIDISAYRIVDMSYTFGEDTLYWPTDMTFEHKQVAFGPTPGGYFYSSYQYGGSEHGGTHLDAPIHFAEGKQGAAAIPIERLIGPVAVVDISAKCENDADYLLSAADIEADEAANGKIEPGTIVLVRAGWGRFWPDKKTYLGTDVPKDVANLHFPGVSPEAAELLVARQIGATGIDTASIDRGASTDFRAHQVLCGAEIPVLENVANLNELPARGATLFALPMKIGHGSGAPVRIVALLPKQ
jgi:kynurenine formamidase